ncbi:MAG: insulinase family protein [Acidobacteriia bacterium]|nr:insulinase family protein [Terriglobia bacterium]
MARLALAMLLLAAMSTSAMWAQESSHPAAKPGATRVGQPRTASENVPTIKFEKYKLANGLEVILSEDHRLPLVAVDLWYHVGPANERPGLTGFAHLFEHMMFQGSKHVGNFDKVIEGIGATQTNGTTDFDRTNYFETVPSDQLETALWVESDRMGWLLDGLNETKLKNQRDVVRNERRQSLEGQPYGLVEEGLFHLVYPKTHPYYAEVIGSHADVEAANLKDVREFFKTYYAPNNATIAIVGDFDTKTVKAWTDKYFGPVPSGPPVPKIEAVTPPITQERRATITDKVQLPRVEVAWLTPAYFKPGDADADLLASILGGGKSSRLYKKLVYEKQIAQDVRAGQNSMMLGSLFQITATAKPGVKPDELEKAIEAELAAVQKDGVTQAEVERARNTIETRTIQGLQRLGGFGGKADLLNQYNHYTGDPGYLSKDLARYNEATTASVQKLAQTLTANSCAVVYGVPGEKVVDDVPQRPEPAASATAEKMPGGPGGDEWRNGQPKPGKRSALQLPVPEEFKLPNGMQVYLVEQHELPVLTAQLTALRGSEANPADRAGLASFTAEMMNEGTEKRTSPQLADDIAQIGASLNAGSSADASTITGSGLTKNADNLFDLLSDMALHPAFREEEIERTRKRRLTTLLQQNDNPGILANRVFAHEVYGDKSPYGFLETGTPESTQATTREDLVKFYKGGFAPANCALVVAGDVTELQLKRLAMTFFGWWTGQGTVSKPPMIGNRLTRRVVIVDKPNAPQSALRIGQVGLQRSHPDFVPVTVMNDILGGMFSSRINMNLREVHGYTYGAFTSFQFRRGTGPFVVGSMVRTDVTAPAVKEVFAELERMRTTEVSPEELSAAKETFERGLTADFETTTRTAGTMSNLFVYGLPPDYYRTLPTKIGAVSAAEVQRMADRYLAPNKMVIVIAGDRAKVEPELKKLELGTVEAQDVEGKPIMEKKAAGGQQ